MRDPAGAERATVPPAIQGVAALLALVVAALNVVPGASLVSDGAWIAGTGHLLTGLAFVGLFTWVAASPRGAGTVLARRFGLHLDDGAHVLAAILQVVFLYLVFGGTVVATADGLQTLADTGENPAGSGGFTAEALLVGLLINLVFFVVAATSWLFLVHGHRGAAMVRELGLQLERFPRGLAWGLGATVLVIIALAAISYGLQALGAEPDNPQADAIAKALTPALAVLVALMAAFGEEIYFRGFLQPRTGIFWQAALFGAIHATYLTPLQVVLPFLLGLLLGVLRERVGLWAPITTHAAYNATALIAAITLSDQMAAAGLG